MAHTIQAGLGSYSIWRMMGIARNVADSTSDVVDTAKEFISLMQVKGKIIR